jgi:hypothetical protein
MSLICMASPSIPSSCFQPLGQPCEWDSTTETCWRRVGIHRLLMKYVIIFYVIIFNERNKLEHKRGRESLYSGLGENRSISLIPLSSRQALWLQSPALLLMNSPNVLRKAEHFCSL